MISSRARTLKGNRRAMGIPGLWGALLLAILLGGLLPRTAGAYEHRRNTPSVGGQFQLGLLGGNSGWADVFQPGHGLTVRVKQYIARNRAIGLSFELQRFSEASVVPLPDPDFRPDYLQMHILMLDYYIYFNRAQKRTPYLIFSGGFYHPEVVNETTLEGGGESQTVEYPKENLLARVGVGMEYFVARTFSIDGSISGYFINHLTPSDDADAQTHELYKSGLTVTGMAALGVHIYVGK